MEFDAINVVTPPTSPLEITSDLTTVRVVIGELVTALKSGPKSRERALVITKLQEAGFWALQGLAEE